MHDTLNSPGGVSLRASRSLLLLNLDHLGATPCRQKQARRQAHRPLQQQDDIGGQYLSFGSLNTFLLDRVVGLPNARGINEDDRQAS